MIKNKTINTDGQLIVSIDQEERMILEELELFKCNEIDKLLEKIKYSLIEIINKEYSWNVNYRIVEDFINGRLGLSTENSRGDELLVFIYDKNKVSFENPIIKLTIVSSNKISRKFTLYYKSNTENGDMWIDGLEEIPGGFDIEIPALEKELDIILSRILEGDELKKICNFISTQ